MRTDLRTILPRTLLLLLLLPLFREGKGQDFHLSQNGTAPLYINPAMTGMVDGLYRAHGHYRTQWTNLTPHPFVTSLFSFDMPLKKFGAGLQVINQTAGAGNYGVTNIVLSGAYDTKITGNGNNRLAAGIQGGIIQKSVDVNQLSFHNQYTPQNGGGFDRSLASGEQFQNTSVLMHDINAGLLYYYSKENSKLNPFAGVSVWHISEPKESFFGSNNKIPRRYTVHGGVKVNLKRKFQIIPKAFTMFQSNDREYTASVIGHYYLEGSDAWLIFGPTWRTRDAVILEAGVKYQNYQARVSYDVNTSTLRPVTNGNGGFEISLTYTGKKKKPDKVLHCPRL